MCHPGGMAGYWAVPVRMAWDWGKRVIGVRCERRFRFREQRMWWHDRWHDPTARSEAFCFSNARLADRSAWRTFGSHTIRVELQTAETGKREMGKEKWETENGKWEMGNGNGRVEQRACVTGREHETVIVKDLH